MCGKTATQYELSPPPGDAISSIAFAPNTGTQLLVSSWDMKLYLYDIVNGPSENNLVNTFEHRAPILDVCYGADDGEAFTAGMDWTVNRYCCYRTHLRETQTMCLSGGG